ncbi:NIPSNAP family protein [Kutzneria buriramensis]|uniref:NIPSNAP protein n=1 Tax=Kutzneria buriramensis TaxID=1045776 RepID=A0A3E0HII4_9PSEU|nr:NIPSNAP family protein [Kutzneria buriramensis]REH46251.1 NIPSNAP protein [Kutzneria buriramensis]
MNVVELRQYTLRPGQRDVLIDLFDREFVETQEEVGIRVIGQFRDEDEPDRFVWIRAFPDMDVRRDSLTAFYVEGVAWREHRAAARATMLDTSNALLLSPARPHSGFTPMSPRPPAGADTPPESRIAVTIYARDTALDEDFLSFFEDGVAPVMAATGATPLAYFATKTAENTFPTLPVREGENVFVWLAAFTNTAQRREHERQLAQSTRWHQKVLPDLSQRLSAPPQHLRLAPTARSQLR